MICSDISQGGKEAASNVVEGAKGVVKLSQKEAEVAGTGNANPSGDCTLYFSPGAARTYDEN